jgi:hypothetical protein
MPMLDYAQDYANERIEIDRFMVIHLNFFEWDSDQAD